MRMWGCLINTSWQRGLAQNEMIYFDSSFHLYDFPSSWQPDASTLVFLVNSAVQITLIPFFPTRKSFSPVQLRGPASPMQWLSAQQINQFSSAISNCRFQGKKVFLTKSAQTTSQFWIHQPNTATPGVTDWLGQCSDASQLRPYFVAYGLTSS